MRQLELRRHARRDPNADRLSAAGRAQAEDVGRAATAAYVVVFVSPSQRAAETAAWFLRGAGQQLPDHEVVPGLGRSATHRAAAPQGWRRACGRCWTACPMAAEASRSATPRWSSTPRSGSPGARSRRSAECEGILVTLGDDGAIDVEELRLDAGTDGR